MVAVVGGAKAPESAGGGASRRWACPEAGWFLLSQSVTSWRLLVDVGRGEVKICRVNLGVGATAGVMGSMLEVVRGEVTSGVEVRGVEVRGVLVRGVLVRGTESWGVVVGETGSTCSIADRANSRAL